MTLLISKDWQSQTIQMLKIYAGERVPRGFIGKVLDYDLKVS